VDEQGLQTFLGHRVHRSGQNLIEQGRVNTANICALHLNCAAWRWQWPTTAALGVFQPGPLSSDNI